ncbi:MAG: hypothetical protein HY342_01020 [Candidatus Lambdaproteobacteria bacterium]|nr:hypothetical protein [Candidatus Lambdaproteobacteria bacterium]
MSLDSLVDIVSNNVGILIILAAFMALFALINPTKVVDAPPDARLELPPQRLEVPWSHATTKNTIYLIVRGNRILPVDLRALYAELANRPAPKRLEPIEVALPNVNAKFYPVTNFVYCLEFFPQAGSGESWLHAQQLHSRWNRVRERYPGEKYVYFFWVSGDSFELFRDLRRRLWDENVEVGWQPIAAERTSMAVCNGFDGSTAFQPQ